MYEQQPTQYQNNLCEKLRVTKSRSIYSQNTWHQAVIDEPFQKTTCHLSFWIKWKQNQIQWEYDQYKLRLHSEQYIEKGSEKYIQLIIQSRT
jgi:lysophospholipid acyltransferase (LPLAT)-like uncharacterized protein